MYNIFLAIEVLAAKAKAFILKDSEETNTNLGTRKSVNGIVLVFLLLTWNIFLTFF